MRELKTIKITGTMINGNIFEVVDKEEGYHLHFRIDEMTGLAVDGSKNTKKVRMRYTLEEVKELREDLGLIIERMEKEL